jgi:hypothetical protein
MGERIIPVGLKGYEITERMKELMGGVIINENKKTSVLELTKVGPDGKVYGIVRENHEYYIKTTSKTKNLVVEDFTYIGGLQNKKQEAYPSYAKAIKHLNLKFNSLNEAYNKSGQINVFENDNLDIDDSIEETEIPEEIDETLDKVEQDVEDMTADEIPSNPEDPTKQPGYIHEKRRLSIGKAINDMDSIIEGVVKSSKKKVYTLI